MVHEPGEQGDVYSVAPVSQAGPVKQFHRMEMCKALIDPVLSEGGPTGSDEAVSSSSGSATDSDNDSASCVLLPGDCDVSSPTIAEDSVLESSTVLEAQPLRLRRSRRTTAGQHSNPYGLPRRSCSPGDRSDVRSFVNVSVCVSAGR